MLNPGDYSLCDLAITTALNAVAQTPMQNLEGMLAATIEARLACGSGGTSAKAYVQVTLDGGADMDRRGLLRLRHGERNEVINLRGLTPKLTPLTPSDGAFADDTFVDGVLGSAMRVKLVTTGTYSNTVLSVKLSAR